MAGGLLGRQFLQMVAIPPDKLLFNAELLKAALDDHVNIIKLLAYLTDYLILMS